MKLHNFVNDSVEFLLSEDFNETFWLTYLALGSFGLCCMSIFFIPPVFFAGVAIVLTPLVLYGALWVGVGLLKLVDLVFGPSKAEREGQARIEEALSGNSPKAEYFACNDFEDDADKVARVEEDSAVSFREAYGQPAKHLLPGYKPEFVFNAEAADQSNPLRNYPLDTPHSEYDSVAIQVF